MVKLKDVAEKLLAIYAKYGENPEENDQFFEESLPIAAKLRKLFEEDKRSQTMRTDSSFFASLPSSPLFMIESKNVSGQKVVVENTYNIQVTENIETLNGCWPDQEGHNEVANVEEVVEKSIAPSKFPSLFGRSVQSREPSPISSPQKFVGIYQILFKDILTRKHVTAENIEPADSNSSIIIEEPEVDTNEHYADEPDLVKRSLFCESDTQLVTNLSPIDDDSYEHVHNDQVDDTVSSQMCDQDLEVNHYSMEDCSVHCQEDDIDSSCSSTSYELDDVFNEEITGIDASEEAAVIEDESEAVQEADICHVATIEEKVNDGAIELNRANSESFVQYSDDDSEAVQEADSCHVSNMGEEADDVIELICAKSESFVKYNDDEVSDEPDVKEYHDNTREISLARNSVSNLRKGSSQYVPPILDASNFLVTGRNDGASTHFIPILNSQRALTPELAEPIVPFAIKDSAQTENGSSKTEFKELLKNMPAESNASQRLSFQAVLDHQNKQSQEVIILDSDGDDDFNRTAQKIILDTDDSSATPVPVEVHPILCKVLKKHQVEGIRFMYKNLIGKVSDVGKKGGNNVHLGAVLAHCMGLGKTLQVIAFLHTILRHPIIKKHIKRVLILCPANVVLNWANEFRKWLTDLDKAIDVLKFYELTTPKNWVQRKEILKKWASIDQTVVIMGYELFRNSFKELKPHLLTSPGPDIVITDEAHTLNNPNTDIFKAVRKIPTLRRVSLTGTPIQNNLQEYYYMVDFVCPNILGTFNEFKRKFIQPIDAAATKDASEYDAENMKKKASILWKQLEMVMHRKNFQILAKMLPKKKEYILFLRLTDVQNDLYKRYIELRKDSTTLAQHQLFAEEHTVYRICSFPYNVKKYDTKKNAKLGDWYSGILNKHKSTSKSFEHGIKLIFVIDLLKWFERIGEKTIIFTHSLEVLNVLTNMLESKHASWFNDQHCDMGNKRGWGWKRDLDYFVIQGDTPAQKRVSLIKQFNDKENKRGRLFFCTEAGMIGTNMTGATRVILFETKYNPSKEIQAIFRTYRLGQDRPVHVYRLIAQGSMEECVMKRQIVKQQLAARVLDNEGVDRTIQRNDVNELLKFCPAPKDVNYTKNLNYHSSGDKAFDTFCSAHVNEIVEICDYDSMIAFNEEEKLAVDIADKEWDAYCRQNMAIQDEVFSNIQQETFDIYMDSQEEPSKATILKGISPVISHVNNDANSSTNSTITPKRLFVNSTSNVKPPLLSRHFVTSSGRSGNVSTNVARSTISSTTKTAQKRRAASPEIICLDDSENLPPKKIKKSSQTQNPRFQKK